MVFEIGFETRKNYGIWKKENYQALSEMLGAKYIHIRGIPQKY
jgi:hypothetical protein